MQSLVHTVEANVTNWITGEWKPLDVNDPGFMISRAGDAFFEVRNEIPDRRSKQVVKVAADRIFGRDNRSIGDNGADSACINNRWRYHVSGGEKRSNSF